LNPLLNAMSAENEVAASFNELQQRTIPKDVFDNYHDYAEASVVCFDTKRIWANHISAVWQPYSDAKMICCERNPFRVFDSVERLSRKNVVDVNGMV